MVGPALSALLANPPWEGHGDLGPAGAILFDSFLEELVFLFSPLGADVFKSVGQLHEPVVAADFRAADDLADALPGRTAIDLD